MTMKNADMPAMPIEFNGFGQYAPEAHYGLTKREMMAMHAMQAITPNCLSMNLSQADVAESIAKQSTILADALLKELEK